MSDALDLIIALTGPAGGGPDPRLVLEAALACEVDPLTYCAATLKVGQVSAMRRAAHWAGLAFFDTVPRGQESEGEVVRLEALAELRTLRVRVLDRDVLFCAPSFFELLMLRRRVQDHPELARRICLVPHSVLRGHFVRSSRRALLVGARQALARRWPFATAQLELTRLARIGFVMGLVLLFVLILLVPFAGQLWLLPITVLVLVAPAVLRLMASLHALRSKLPDLARKRPNDGELPVYSVLIPLRDEAHMLTQLHDAMCALDYPPEKLDIIFVVEDRSQATLYAASHWPDDPRFSVVAVPDAAPRTKPKALDFALPLCRGEFVVVFDAEDRPDPDQLWRAALRFRDEPDLQCLQAQLSIDNGDESWLAGLFAGEYAGQFGVLLPALAHWRLPMPLGGTSNHFRIEALRRLGGWDAFNVTEDADIGIRLARLGLRADVLASRTLEEAPVELRSWLSQRSRWMKGWMQTFIVHNRNPGQLLAQMGWRGMLVFELTVLSMIVSPLLHSALLLIMITLTLLGQPVLPALSWSWSGLYFGVLLAGYGASVGLTLVGLHRQRRYRLFTLQLLLPFYWLLMGLATLRALHELIERPFYWAKTAHRVVLSRSDGEKRPAE